MGIKTWSAAVFTGLATAAVLAAPAAAGSSGEAATATEHSVAGAAGDVGAIEEGKEHFGRFFWHSDCAAEGRRIINENPSKYYKYECDPDWTSWYTLWVYSW